MIVALLVVGILSCTIGILLLLLGVGGNVTADTNFGRFRGNVGAVALVLGIVLMASAALI